MQPDHVRHHGRAEDSDGEEHRAAPLELRQHRVAADRAEVGVRLEQLDDVAGADHEHHDGDHRLERPEAEPLQPEDPEGTNGRDAGRGQQRDVEQEVQADRGAEELGEVGRDRDRLGLYPEPEDDPAREAVAAHLGEVPPRCDAELRREHLHEHRHQVRGDDHPDERVAVARAAGDVRCEVAGVDVGDRGDERRTEEWKEPEPRRAARARARPGPGQRRDRLSQKLV